MSPGLTLASSAAPLGLLLDDDDFLPTFTEEVDHETVNFADKLMDIDLTMLNVNTYSSTFSLPFPLSGGIKKIYKKELYLQTSSNVQDYISVDRLSDSSSSDLSSEFSSSLDSPPPRQCDSYKRFLRMSPVRCRPYYPARDTPQSWRQSHQQVKKEPGFVNPREEMNLMRMSCTCQSRNTGKSLHLWEFLLEMLADKRMRSVIAWTGHEREFRVVNSREVAREWGNRKNKPHMNFDKMSRAMRYYYKKNILTHGNKQRLVYSFSLDPLCPHYEKIITLALKTRPSTGGTTIKESDSPPHAEVLESWEVAPPKKPTESTGPLPSDSNKAHKIVTTRVPSKKPPVSGVRSNDHQTSRSKSKSRLDLSKDNHDQNHRTIIRASNASRLVSYNNPPKIKINTKRPSYNDCFKFS